MKTLTMSAKAAATLFRNLKDAGVRCWAIGGWGVDALLGRVTREHHDLDLLVDVDDLATLHVWLIANEFEWCYDWEENRPIRRGDQLWTTAFVAAHADGRELDVHAITRRDDGIVELATADPWRLPAGALDGRGSIDGLQIECVSREAQKEMHAGYELPAHHLADLDALELGKRSPGSGQRVQTCPVSLGRAAGDVSSRRSATETVRPLRRG